jgi:hypothetical protein
MKNISELLRSSEFKFVLDYFRRVEFSNRQIYANWLAQTHYFVSHSVRLSALGASRLDVDHPLSRRMVAHTKEEMGHHIVAKRDIEALGKKLEDYPALGVTNAFFQSQYFKVLFENPAHLLGQILMLEAVSVEVGPWMYEIVKSKFGGGASRFVEIHAHEDKDHVSKALAALNELPAAEKAGVAVNFRQACEMYYLILRSVNEAGFAQLVKQAA